MRGLLYLYLWTLGGACLLGTVWLHMTGQQLASVASNSMRPTFVRGDALVVRPVPVNELAVGDVVGYRTTLDDRVIVSHRLLAKQADGRLITGGDYLKTADRPVSEQQVVGRVMAIAPDLGRVIDALHSWIGLSVCVGLPVILLLGMEGSVVWRALTHTQYQYRAR